VHGAARRVLLVEDNPGDARLIVEMLVDSGGDLAVENVGTLASAVERLETNDIDVALLDLCLPDSEGLETFTRLRDTAPGVAIVVLTGNADVELAVRAVKEGASDFLVKGRVDAEQLTRAIAYAHGRQQSENAVRREKALLAAAQEIARLGSWRYDLATETMWWSDEMYRIFEIDRGVPAGDRAAAVQALVHPEDVAIVPKMVAAVGADGTSRSTRHRILLPDGAVRWIDSHGRQERGPHGQVVAVAGFSQDVTELKLAEERAVLVASLDRAVAALSAAMVAAEPSLARLAELVLDDAKVLTRSPIGSISACDPVTSEADVRVPGDGDGASVPDAPRVSKSGAHVSCADASGRSSDPGKTFYTNSPAPGTTLAETPEKHVPIVAFLSVAAIADRRLVGQITVANAPGGYTDEDLETVKRLAALYAIAVVGQEERAALIESESSLRQSNENFERMVYGVAEAMGRIVEVRDPYTQGHEVRVARLAKLIAEEMHLPEDDVDAIEMSGLVHDIGKLGVPAEILTKPRVLTEVEFALIKEHPEAGYTILKGVEFPWPIADIVLAHHERLDGSGYPHGLVGEAILLASRVLAVADVVEAMASHRPYRPALGLDAAVTELTESAGKYDPDVVRAFLTLYGAGRVDF
jgi:putative nucleotidyltransferase with HDIG domain